MRIVLDTNILVRASAQAIGPARELLLLIAKSPDDLLLSPFLLQELVRIVRAECIRIEASEAAPSQDCVSDTGRLVAECLRKHQLPFRAPCARWCWSRA